MSQCIKCVARLRQSYRAPCRARATHWLSPLWQPSSRRFRRSMGSPRPRAPPIPRRHHFPCGQGPWSTCSLNGPSTDWLQATCIWMLLQWTRTRRADGFVGEVWQLMRRSQELRRAQDINPGSSDRSNRAWHKGAGGPGTSRPGGATRFLIGPVSPSRRLRVRSMPRSIALPRSGSTDDAAPLGSRRLLAVPPPWTMQIDAGRRQRATIRTAAAAMTPGGSSVPASVRSSVTVPRSVRCVRDRQTYRGVTSAENRPHHLVRLALSSHCSALDRRHDLRSGQRCRLPRRQPAARRPRCGRHLDCQPGHAGHRGSWSHSGTAATTDAVTPVQASRCQSSCLTLRR